MIRKAMPVFCAAALAVAAPHVADAAYIDVLAIWGVSTFGLLPDSLELTGDLGDTVSDIHTFTGKTNETFTSTKSFSITNITDTIWSDQNGLLIDIQGSAFNPFGDEVGLSIDSTHQMASYSSVITTDVVGELDEHRCTLPNRTDYFTYFSPTTCGVRSPDTTDLEFWLFSLDPGESYTVNVTTTISATFDPVPEPSGLLVMGPMVLGLGLLRLRR